MNGQLPQLVGEKFGADFFWKKIKIKKDKNPAGKSEFLSFFLNFYFYQKKSAFKGVPAELEPLDGPAVTGEEPV